MQIATVLLKERLKDRLVLVKVQLVQHIISVEQFGIMDDLPTWLVASRTIVGLGHCSQELAQVLSQNPSWDLKGWCCLLGLVGYQDGVPSKARATGEGRRPILIYRGGQFLTGAIAER